MTTDLDGFAAKLAAIDNDLHGRPLRNVVDRLGEAAEADMNEVVRRDVGPDRRMSGWPVKLDIGYAVETEREASLTPAKAADGAWTVLEYGRQPGAVAPKTAARIIVRTPHGLRTFTKSHPLRIGATRAKRTASRAIAAAIENTPQRAADELHAIYARRIEQA